ncbi:hypothetical protein ACYZT4_27080 [Pseudomonas sp. GB2N2]
MSVEKFEESGSVITGLSPENELKAGEKLIEYTIKSGGAEVDFRFKYEFRGLQVSIELTGYRVRPGNGRNKGKLSVWFLGAPYYNYIGKRVTDKAIQSGGWQGLIYGQALTQRGNEGISVRCEYQLDTPGGDPPSEYATFFLHDHTVTS